MTERRRRIGVSLFRVWIHCVALLAPPNARDRWREEWEGELHLGWEPSGARLRQLSGIALGALRDALDLRVGVRRSAAVGDPTAHPSPAWSVAGLGGLARHSKHACRRAARYPAMTLGVVGVLGLGIGANTALFVVADAILWRPLPYPDAERFWYVWESGPQEGTERVGVSVPDYLDWRTRETAFEELAAFNDVGLNVESADRSFRVDGQVVSSNYLRLLGGAPVLGRDFGPRDELEGGARSVILSHGFWQRHLSGDPDAIGQALRVNGDSYAVVGIMPAGFRSPGGAELWLPLSEYGGNLRIWRATHVLTLLGRLGTGADPRQVEADLTQIAQDIWERAPLFNGWRVSVRPFRSEVYGELTSSARFLWASALALFLLMCANLSNLLLAGAVKRRSEFAVRRALGAEDRDLRLQAVLEQALLGLMAVAVGWLVSTGLVAVLEATMPPALTAIYDLEVDLRGFGYSLVLGICVSASLGLLSLSGDRKSDVAHRLRSGGRTVGSGARTRMRGVLIAGQVGLSLVLVVATLLLVDSQRRVRAVDPGFRAAGLVSLRVSLAGPEYAEPAVRRQFAQRAERELAVIAGVEDVGMGSRVPFEAGMPGSGASIFVVGRVAEPGSEQPLGDVIRVSSSLLPTLGITQTAGRLFREADDHDSPRVALVNRTAAQMLWPDSPAVGARIRTGVTGDEELVVVGVVTDARLVDLRRPASPQVYVTAAQFPPRGLAFVIRTDRTLESIVPELRAAIRNVDQGQPAYDVAGLDHYVERSLAASTLAAQLLSSFAVAALVLAGIGIYAVVAFMTRLRAREFGIRRALGAGSADVTVLIVREGAVLLGAGLIGGTVAAASIAQLASSQLFGVSPLEPRIYLVSTVVLIATAALSAVAPVARAASVRPASILRDD